ncbi:DUF29 domain-containing protein [Massilia sp. TWP1-3-3]|uniref:DUF29 domain-containing protein n=1 Tax=Massilia sp. TWP1-3-3 TaxID=2804573 RepID=UPI003CF9BE5E
MLKWQFQPGLRGKRWRSTMTVQRRLIARRLRKAPSLRRSLSDEEWLEDAWDDAIGLAIGETGLHEFPDEPIWRLTDILDPAFLLD